MAQRVLMLHGQSAEPPEHTPMLIQSNRQAGHQQSGQIFKAKARYIEAAFHHLFKMTIYLSSSITCREYCRLTRIELKTMSNGSEGMGIQTTGKSKVWIGPLNTSLTLSTITARLSVLLDFHLGLQWLQLLRPSWRKRTTSLTSLGKYVSYPLCSGGSHSSPIRNRLVMKVSRLPYV